MSADKGNATRKGFRQRLTDELISVMEDSENGIMPGYWKDFQARPFNPFRRSRYRGGNALHLSILQAKRESTDPRWMTLRQANKAGYHIRKGAKGALVEYWDFGDQVSVEIKTDEDGYVAEYVLPHKTAPLTKEERKPKVYYAVVFNGADIEGLPPFIPAASWEPVELAERLLKDSGAVISHQTVSTPGWREVSLNENYYLPSKDVIVLTPKASFSNPVDYYSVALHELAHWTGHSSRLNRIKPGASKEDYAKEELRAEIASVFLRRMLELHSDLHRPARYLKHYLEDLQNDRHEIFRAARDAEVIVDYLLDLSPEVSKAIDEVIELNAVNESDWRKPSRAFGFDLPSFGNRGSVSVSIVSPGEEDSGPLNSVPASTDASSASARVGSIANTLGELLKDDPKWPIFVSSALGQAERTSLTGKEVSEALREYVESFADLMQRSEVSGDPQKAAQVFLREVISSIARSAYVNECEASWKKFEKALYGAKDSSVTDESLRLLLNEASWDYQKILNEIMGDSLENWSPENSAKSRKSWNVFLRGVLFGDTPVKKVDSDFVNEFMNRRRGEVASRALGEDEDLVISAAGGSALDPDSIWDEVDEAQLSVA